MKHRIQLTLSFLFLGLLALSAQEVDTTNFQTFDYEDEGQIYVMQQYFLVFLKRGDSKSETEEEAQKIQAAHLEYLGGWYEKGYICMNGPFGDDGEIRGATVYRVSSADEALSLASNDPAVKAGRLKVEVHPWWLARGTGVR